MNALIKPFKTVFLFFLLQFVFGLVPTSKLNAQGPNTPEAASFEPVDATDMVNLVTGDFTYVLPLLNVPSPEGGYPIALSYHAGIAMEQEASWVGLGWSLNPGAINRSVNGYPDDWGKTEASELYYDEGGTTDYYSFSIGGTLPNGVTLGVSAAWGGYRAWGGIVGYGGQSFHFGSEGIGARASLGGLSVSALPGQDVTTSIGLGSVVARSGPLSLVNSSLSLNTDKIFLPGRSTLKSEQTGTGLSSGLLNFSIGGAAFNNGAIGNSTSLNNGDYLTKITENGFNFDVGFFWISYRHTQVSYSLFKDNIIYPSGILNAFDYKLNNTLTTIDDSSVTMDVKEFYADDKDFTRSDYHDITKSISLSNIMLPNYDNYSVSGQGIGGSISPRIYDEIVLSSRKRYEERNDSDNIVLRNYTLKYHDQVSTNQSEISLNNKIYFYFENSVSSFLRTSTGNFDLSTPINNLTDLLSLNTLGDSTFDSSFLDNSIPKKNGERKRDGSFIETFTIGDINNNNTNGWFIETKSEDFYRQNDPNRFTHHKDENSIGAYRITSLDGKVYHYSLPVYHNEAIYKNFKQGDDENKKFFRSKKTKPYATHWLLTAITGSDYVDVNSNGELDEDDYGYWVEFEYGRWSDGYGWRSPREGFKSQGTSNSYFMGVKEIYYLDQIKTRTHTALFVKSVRNDNKSTPISIYKNKWNQGLDIYDENISEYFIDKDNKDYVVNGMVYPTNGVNGGLSFLASNSPYSSHKKLVTSYMDIPKSFSLKLDKILIFKNKDVNYDKINSNNFIIQETGYSYHNSGLKGFLGYRTFFNPIKISQTESYSPNRYDINMGDRVLLTNDIYPSLEAKAISTISFNYDYSLSSNLPNSNSGHLTLKSLYMNGKSGVEIMPPYKFSYIKSHISYNKDNQDVWGFVTGHPDAWSLNKITTPLGADIEIDYEADSFYAEAAYRTRHTYERFNFSSFLSSFEDNTIINFDIGSNYIDVFFDSSKVSNISQLAILGAPVEIHIYRSAFPYYFMYKNRNSRYRGSIYQLESVNENQNSIRFVTNELTNMSFHEELLGLPSCPITEHGTSPSSEDDFCIRTMELSLDSGFLTFNDTNGRKGGGLRVKNIKVKENGKTYKTEYNYNNPVTNRISGITSYEPFDGQSKIVPYIEELPAPNVMYSNVCVSTLDNEELKGHIKYTFNTLTPFNITDNNDDNVLYALGDEFKVIRNQSRKHTIHNVLANIGKLQSVKTYNSKGQLINSVYNNYLKYDPSDDNRVNGISQESFKAYKSLRSFYHHTTNYIPNDPLRAQYLSVGYQYSPLGSSKVIYPSVLESTTTSQGGFTATTYFNKYDFLTGQIKETTTKDSKGNEFKTEIVPAYMKYPHMGAKVDNSTNKNMLTQEALTKTYLKVDTEWKETGVGITTWNNDWTYTDYKGDPNHETAFNKLIWRKHKSFVWDGNLNSDGTFSGFTGDDDGFEWGLGDPQTNNKWKNISTNTQYDHYSMPLEVQDINENYASTKTCDTESKVMAVCNAAYTEMYYSGAEYTVNDANGNSLGYFDGQVMDTGELDVGKDNTHTGTHIVRLTNTTDKAFEVGLPNNVERTGLTGKFKVSVWARKGQEQRAKIVVGSLDKFFSPEETIYAGGWVLLNGYIDIPSTGATVAIMSTGGTLDLDDFRLHPIASTMTSYVYNEWDELWCIIGSNGLSTKFEYDPAGRLEKTYTEVADYNGAGSGGFKRVSENDYNYKRTLTDKIP